LSGPGAFKIKGGTMFQQTKFWPFSLFCYRFNPGCIDGIVRYQYKLLSMGWASLTNLSPCFIAAITFMDVLCTKAKGKRDKREI
jgi:hypothetical protein